MLASVQNLLKLVSGFGTLDPGTGLGLQKPQLVVAQQTLDAVCRFEEMNPASNATHTRSA